MRALDSLRDWVHRFAESDETVRVRLIDGYEIVGTLKDTRGDYLQVYPENGDEPCIIALTALALIQKRTTAAGEGDTTGYRQHQ